ncbi:HNH endonuclease [Luteibacter anthropi]|uniref:RHS repeat-associated core domain-containing protein n=1 Tax=Luteibacter anthropi TaxID=564369 RepID=UPI002032E02E|nr:RHS repeat-associated core domain-containing protein [Luteibacter anthropi]URX62468.1 HNH endonuclease [Luteibacter anthropi]
MKHALIDRFSSTKRPGVAFRMVVMFVVMVISAMLHTMASAQAVTYYYTDPQGTVLATADAQGNILTQADRRPYGEQVMGTPQDGPGYTGHVDDSDSGLIYMQARYYDPAVGRFLSVDPERLVASNVNQFPRYAYANNNPIVNTDPDGRQTMPPSVYRFDWTKPENRSGFVETAIPFTPIVSDVQNISDAISDPSPVNILAAVVGAVPEGGGPLAKILKEGSAGGKRAGMAFTRAGKAEVKEANALAHEGRVVCEACGRETVPAKQSQKGVTPPGDEAHVDHVIPKSKGGDGFPSNGQVLCRDCNLDKGAN